MKLLIRHKPKLELRCRKCGCSVEMALEYSGGALCPKCLTRAVQLMEAKPC
jgi:Zn finger protein HypA/HybF involved in hydrogenase expression